MDTRMFLHFKVANKVLLSSHACKAYQMKPLSQEITTKESLLSKPSKREKHLEKGLLVYLVNWILGMYHLFVTKHNDKLL